MSIRRQQRLASAPALQRHGPAAEPAQTNQEQLAADPGQGGARAAVPDHPTARPLRQAAMQRIQHSQGNRAAQRLIQREISWELKDGPAMSVPTTLSNLSEDEMLVLAWLREHQAEIMAAEQRFHVDRRAIAGAIAWEALKNAKSSIRAFGAGKVHAKSNFFTEGNPVAKQVEDAGYLPKQTLENRKQILATPGGSITYIAGIMAALADVAARSGYDIRSDPAILTNMYQGPDLDEWKKRMAAKKAPAPLKAGNDMGVWVEGHIPFLEEAVGSPDLPGSPDATVPPTPVASQQSQQQSIQPFRDPLSPIALTPAQRQGAVMKHALQRGTPAVAPAAEAQKADPAAQAQALLAEAPATSKDYAAWVLKAHDQGFVKFKARAKEDLEGLKGGQKVGKADPLGDDIIPSLLVMRDIVKGPAQRWVDAGAKGDKPSVTLGSYITANGGGTRDAPHGTGKAIDVNDLDVAATVANVIAILGDLSAGAYGLGMPFQGDFFDSADDIEQKKKAEEAKPEPGPVTNCVKKFTSHIYQATWDKEKKTWHETIEQAGQAYTLLQSDKLKDALKTMRKAGTTLTIFPDNPNHLHVDKR